VSLASSSTEVPTMQTLTQALDEIQDLYRTVVGFPAPELDPSSYLDFPPGVDPIQHAVQEVVDLREMSRKLATAPRASQWMPAADIVATRDAWTVRLEVPGIPRDHLKVLVTAEECIVRGRRDAAVTSPEERPLVIERPSGTFERRFVLPAGVRGEGVTARYGEGVLELRIPLQEKGAATETSIEVKYGPEVKK
jgi:HSP20 family protein